MKTMTTVRKGGLLTPDGFLFELTGGDPALDFANTVDCRKGGEPRELLPSYEELARWAQQREIITEEERDRLFGEARRRGGEARRVMRQALALREVLFEIFAAVGRRQPPPAAAVQRLEKFAHTASRQRRLVTTSGRTDWRWRGEKDLDRMLWPVIQAATELLTSERASRIRVCDGDICAWLFLDNSRKGNRRWCDMTVCGNREKARRHYARKVLATSTS